MKRMINTDIVQSFGFLTLPISAQYLYFQLCCSCDDRGVVEAGNIMRLVNANLGDLQNLVENEYIIILNKNFVSYIKDFNLHNSLRPDRIKESIYADLLVQVTGVQLIPKKERADIKNKTKNEADDMDVQWTSNGRLNIR